MIKLGNNNIGKVYFGSHSIGKAYMGSNLVFQSGLVPPPPTTAWSDAGLSNITAQNIFIHSTSNKWATGTGWYCKFLPVVAGTYYKILAGHNDVTRYAFMTANTYSDTTTVNTYATGYTGTILVGSGEESAPVPAPQDATYLYVLTAIGSGDTGASVKVYNGATSIVNVDISGVAGQNIFINSTSNKWATGTGWYSKFLPIEAGALYQVTAGHNGVTRYAFMTANTYSKNTTVNTYADGHATCPRVEIDESSGPLAAPPDANYLWFLTQIGSGETGVTIQKITLNNG